MLLGMSAVGQGPPVLPRQDAVDWISQVFAAPPPPPLPATASHRTVREAIATVLARMSANELADECIRFGLEPSTGGSDDPWQGKWRYVERRLRHRELPDLLALARKVTEIYEDPVLDHLLGIAGARGVHGELKNLIFAANGPKPKIILRDAVNNDLEIVENGEHCLVYDRPLAQTGLTWRQLIAWWGDDDQLAGDAERDVALSLYRRLLACMAGNAAERFIFTRYCALYRTLGFETPALIPQVYLHYDPYTRRASMPLTQQRMDFLVLLPHRRRVVIELDGIQHYADDKQRADPQRYAQMVAGDRVLQLAGYEVYRFGGHELANRKQAAGLLEDFFASLLDIARSPE
jgi:very-short-patch-repair endonuclease